MNVVALSMLPNRAVTRSVSRVAPSDVRGGRTEVDGLLVIGVFVLEAVRGGEVGVWGVWGV